MIGREADFITNETDRVVTSETERTAQIGGVLVGYKPIGEVRKLTGDEGFSQAASYPYEHNLFSEETSLENITLVEATAKKIMSDKGWDGIDILVGASVSARRSVPHRVAENLRAQGFTIGQSLDYYCACMGGMAALGDILMNPQNIGKRIAIITYEFLSGNVMNPEDSKGYNATRNMFGNGLTYLAAQAGVDIEAIQADVWVQPDLEKVIAIPQAEETLTDPDDELLTPPAYYHYVDPETHEVQDDNFDWSSQPYFVFTNKGVRLEMPESGTGYTEMKGLATLELFAGSGSEYVLEATEAYNRNLESKYHQTGEAIGHQPSKTVLQGLLRKAQVAAILDHLLPNHKTEEQEIKLAKKQTLAGEDQVALDRRAKSLSSSISRAVKLAKMPLQERKQILYGTGIPVIDLPWVMDQALVNNISGGTSFVQMVEMARQGRIKTEIPIPAIVFAIGAMFGQYYFIFH